MFSTAPELPSVPVLAVSSSPDRRVGDRDADRYRRVRRLLPELFAEGPPDRVTGRRPGSGRGAVLSAGPAPGGERVELQEQSVRRRPTSPEGKRAAERSAACDPVGYRFPGGPSDPAGELIALFGRADT